MTPGMVYSENNEKHRCKICQEKMPELYFLLADDEPDVENGRHFSGPFDLVLNKLKELKEAERLKAFDFAGMNQPAGCDRIVTREKGSPIRRRTGWLHWRSTLRAMANTLIPSTWMKTTEPTF
jgi:hypothetical protein